MELIRKYFPGLTALQDLRFRQMHDLYLEWNARINLVSRKDIDQLYERHILHSLSIAMAFPFEEETTILDAGTGGGFPGIPLANLLPSCRFTLVDSIRKKIRVVQDIASKLQLENVEAQAVRVEELDRKFHFVCGRAVTSLERLVDWIGEYPGAGKIAKQENGIIYLKGGETDTDLERFPQARIINLSDFFSEEFFLTKKIIFIPGTAS
jgi:16S rRNA (guanine527-N7)-methyltransferase